MEQLFDAQPIKTSKPKTRTQPPEEWMQLTTPADITEYVGMQHVFDRAQPDAVKFVNDTAEHWCYDGFAMKNVLTTYFGQLGEAEVKALIDSQPNTQAKRALAAITDPDTRTLDADTYRRILTDIARQNVKVLKTLRTTTISKRNLPAIADHIDRDFRMILLTDENSSLVLKKLLVMAMDANWFLVPSRDLKHTVREVPAYDAFGNIIRKENWARSEKTITAIRHSMIDVINVYPRQKYRLLELVKQDGEAYIVEPTVYDDPTEAYADISS